MRDDIFKTNSYYEGLVQNLYAGNKGCFSTFMHFFYQYNQSVVFCEALTECFKSLYEIELQNCKILSQLLLKMGGDNKYYSSSRKFLSGNNVDYIKNFQKIFVMDIELLEIGVLETKSIISKIENSVVKTKLKTVLENKKKSLKILKENYFKINIIE